MDFPTPTTKCFARFPIFTSSFRSSLKYSPAVSFITEEFFRYDIDPKNFIPDGIPSERNKNFADNDLKSL